MNVKRAGWEVDAVWDAQRLVVEVDGYEFHAPGPSSSATAARMRTSCLRATGCCGSRGVA